MLPDLKDLAIIAVVVLIVLAVVYRVPAARRLLTGAAV